jgi:2-polyprenyl-3-methyl-5-hydroxy-6-metoxy-1,4-benzoquinol methylase
MKKSEERQKKLKGVKVEEFYNAIAREYHRQYEGFNIEAVTKYPQNYFRLQMLLQRLATLGVKNVYEVGTGEGTPLALMAGMGLQVAGCDIAEIMVKKTRSRLKKVLADVSRVQVGNIEDSLSIANQLSYGPFDALIAFGVMPHVKNDYLALRNMKMFLRKGSRVFIEFRNKLFSLFTFNRHTKNFILNDLLTGIDDEIKLEVARDLDFRLAIDEPSLKKTENGIISYDSVMAKFHNPFEVVELFKSEGFRNIIIHWYHYHPAPPMLEKKFQKKFWEEGMRLEHNPPSWRGLFLCSAFFVEAEVRSSKNDAS